MSSAVTTGFGYNWFLEVATQRLMGCRFAEQLGNLLSMLEWSKTSRNGQVCWTRES